MTHLLDTSALIAYAFKEPGGERIQELIADPTVALGLSVLSVFEVWGRLKSAGREDLFERDWPMYRELFTTVAEVTLPIVQQATALRRGASARLPTVNALIAATAAVHGATLVHRDPHFATLPADLLVQEPLAVG